MKSECSLCQAQARYAEEIRHEKRCPYARAELIRSMPMPRLQLRWEILRDDPHYGWICFYELVIPYGKNDPRNLYEPGFKVASLSWTKSDTPDHEPIRDGRHAEWDSATLGNLPVFMITVRDQIRDLKREWAGR